MPFSNIESSSWIIKNIQSQNRTEGDNKRNIGASSRLYIQFVVP